MTVEMNVTRREHRVAVVEDDVETCGARFLAPVPSTTVPVRPAVSERLSTAAGRLAVVSAPGGYGKSSQVAGWAKRDGRAAAWADLERIDNDPTVLLTVLVRLLGDVTDFDPDLLPLSRRSPDEFATIVVPAFGRLVGRCRKPFVIVLDDAHIIEAPGAIDLLEALARNVPPTSTVVLAGRSEPATSLGRLRLQPGVVEITIADLALSVDDAGELFESMGLVLAPAEVATLVARTEGWPVGLRLAGLAVVGAPDAATAVATFAGHDRYVAEYIREEWMVGLSADEAQLLMQVACLDWFSGPMCDELLGRHGSSRVLERLHTNALLVIPLDRREERYRMHPLLGDFLRDELARVDPGAVRRIHRRASAWFESERDFDRALQHALQAGDLGRGETLVSEHTGEMLTTGCQATVRRWLSSFPEGHVPSRPALCVIAAATALGLGEGDECAGWLRFLEGTLATCDHAEQTNGSPVFQAAMFRALLGIAPLDELLADAESAHSKLAPGPWHATACAVLGGLLTMRGEHDRARSVLTAGAAEAKICGAPTLEAICLAHLALVLDAAGDRDAATAIARSARTVLRARNVEDVATTAMVLAMSALVEASGDELESVRGDCVRSRRHLGGYGSVAPWVNVLTRLVLARTSMLLGDRVAARTLLDEAELHLRRQPDATWPRARLDDLSTELSAARDVLPYGPSSLTTAELRVLHYLPTNLRFGDIAERLFVSRNTAKSHAAAIYRKLGTSSRGEAVDLARKAGLLPASPVTTP